MGSERVSRRSAITLLEVITVLSIVAFLVAMLLPSFAKAKEAARRTSCVANMKHIGSAIFTYAFANDDSGPKVMKAAGTTAPRSLLSRSGRYVNLGLLIENEMSNNASIFYCPSQKQFSYGSNPKYLPKATISGSYAYGVHIPADQSPALARVRHLALASDDFVARLGAKAGIGKLSHRIGYNVLYTDGSAAWYTDPDESIWKRAAHWDNEKDNITYATLYKGGAQVLNGSYGRDLDIFRVWSAFCYNRPDEF